MHHAAESQENKQNKTAKPRKKPNDSEEECNAKPTRKIARNKKKVERRYSH
jgi:hypothetical protein